MLRKRSLRQNDLASKSSTCKQALTLRRRHEKLLKYFCCFRNVIEEFLPTYLPTYVGVCTYVTYLFCIINI